MASIYKRAGRWRAEVRRAGLYQSETFATRAAATAWAAKIEADYEAGRAGRGTSHTLRHTLERFRDEVTPARGGRRSEAVRINALLRDHPDVDRPLSSLTVSDWIAWRDGRRARVADATVRRDMALVRAIVEHARTEWRYVAHNPLAEVTRPPDSPHRTRLVSGTERRALADAAGWTPSSLATSAAVIRSSTDYLLRSQFLTAARAARGG